MENSGADRFMGSVALRQQFGRRALKMPSQPFDRLDRRVRTVLDGTDLLPADAADHSQFILAKTELHSGKFHIHRQSTYQITRRHRTRRRLWRTKRDNRPLVQLQRRFRQLRAQCVLLLPQALIFRCQSIPFGDASRVGRRM